MARYMLTVDGQGKLPKVIKSGKEAGIVMRLVSPALSFTAAVKPDAVGEWDQITIRRSDGVTVTISGGDIRIDGKLIHSC